jgi:hypothetical protein
VLGDGEIDAGVIWEGAMTAAKYRLGNLTAILDYNGVQQTGTTADVMPTEPIADKWQSFGWHAQAMLAWCAKPCLSPKNLPIILVRFGTSSRTTLPVFVLALA